LGRKGVCTTGYRDKKREKEKWDKEREKEKTSGDASNFSDEQPLGQQRHLCYSQWRNSIFKI
jgi:hypothetical protein